MPTAIGEDRLSETFAALANSTRRAILAHLAKSAATVNELASTAHQPAPESSGDMPVRPAVRVGSRSPASPATP